VNGITLLAISLGTYSLGLLALRNGSGSRLFIPAAFITLALTTLSLGYAAAYYFTGEGINRAVIYHLKTGLDGAGYLEYPGLIAGLTTGLVAGIAASIGLVRRALQRKPVASSAPPTLSYMFLAVSLGAHPAVIDLADLYDPFSTAAAAAPDFADAYLRPEKLTASSSPLNLVMIYLEGFERTYLDDSLFPGLTKGLAALEGEGISFTEVNQYEGTGWTIAGMVASQCGIPLEIPNDWDTIFEARSFLPHAVCLGDLLKQQGFHLTYLGGAALTFGNKGMFYQTHAYDEVYGKAALESRLPDKSYQTSWGLYDDSMLELAYEKYRGLLYSQDRFALTLLTVDTHAPRGHMSASCTETDDASTGNDILDAVKCSDRLVTAFVDRIRSTPGSENTLIVLVSDHLGLYNSASRQLRQGKRRILFMALPPGQQTGRLVYRPGSQFDIGPTILGLMGFDTSALGLGRDLLDTEPTLGEQYPDVNTLVTNWLPVSSRFW
jgi:phosphoglycerol transferase